MSPSQKSQLFTDCLKSIKNIGFLFISKYWLSIGRETENPITDYEKDYVYLAYLANGLPKEQKIDYYRQNSINGISGLIQYPSSLSPVQNTDNQIEFVPETISNENDELVILSQLSEAVWFFGDSVKSSSILFAEKMEAKIFNRNLYGLKDSKINENKVINSQDSLIITFQQKYEDSLNFGKCAAWNYKNGEFDTSFCETLEKGRKTEELSYAFLATSFHVQVETRGLLGK